MTIAVTGAAGYIGSHIARLLHDGGTPVVAVDDMSAGRQERIEGLALVRLDLSRDEAPAVLGSEFRRRRVTAVIHLAARKSVGDSVSEPAHYFHQNVAGLANVVTAMRRNDVPRLVFSSSAAVYGAPDPSSLSGGLITEDAPTLPINPYGQTKLAGEWLVGDAAVAYGMQTVSLRYFNVAGAGRPALADTVTANLIPILLDRAAQGLRPIVHGSDYPTPDGSCIRDYVHVGDLADAHLRALGHLNGTDRSDPAIGSHEIFNVGTGKGASVLEVVASVARALHHDLEPEIGPRRAGDPPALVADVSKIERVLGWRAQHGLDDIVDSAVKAMRKPGK